MIQSEKKAPYSYEKEHEYYSKNWPQKALPYKHLEPYLRTWVPDVETLFRGKHVLDIGAGEAIYSRMIAEAFTPKILVACELFRERMLPACKANTDPKLHFAAGNVFQLPFPDGVFDVVWGSLVLSQLPDLDKIIKEINRVLKPDGCYVGIEPNPYNPVTLYRFFRGRRSKNQYLLNNKHLGIFSRHGYILNIRYFYAKFPAMRNRFLTTCMGIMARKQKVITP